MKVTVKERIVLLSVVPKEGDFKTLKQIRKLREDLSFSDKENKMLKFVYSDNGNINWIEPNKDRGKFYTKEVEISDTLMAIIVDALKMSDKQKKLNHDTFELYERFVGDK